MLTPRKLTATLVGLALSGCRTAGAPPAPSEGTGHLDIGQTAPPLAGATLNAEQCGRPSFDLGRHVGESAAEPSRGVILVFGASDCFPCIYLLAMVREIDERRKSEGVTTAFVLTDAGPDHLDAMKSFLAEQSKVGFPAIHLPGASLPQSLGLASLPLILLVDHEGKVVFREDGLTAESIGRLEGALDALGP